MALVGTMLKLYNTLSGKKEAFVPKKPGKVLYYTCGPSVYNFAHIGNLRTFFWEDLLKRLLFLRGLKVVHAMPISDMEDKAIAAFNSQHATTDFEKFIMPKIRKFKQDMDRIGIGRPGHIVRFKKSIPWIITWARKLEKKGAVYEDGRGNLVFRISKAENFGRLAKLGKAGKQKKGVRLSDDYSAQGRYDFAIWKKAARSAGKLKKKSPWGQGRPGTHAYCSAIAYKFLGKSIDIHAGGVDNIFPHHENEIAQSEVIAGRGFVRYWFHVKHLTVNKKKMSKSIGNVYYLKDLEDRGLSPQDLRYYYLQKHYRQKQDFDFRAAKRNAERRLELVHRVKRCFEQMGNADMRNALSLGKARINRLLDDDLMVHLALKAFEKITEKIAGANGTDEKTRKEYVKLAGLLEAVTGLRFR